MGYTKKIITGFSWETVLKVCTYGLTLIKIYILARILNPADFGLFSLVLIALGISESMTQTGINLTIIQSKHSVKYFLDTAWVISIIRGFIIGILMLVVGYGIQFFYQQPNLLMLIALATLTPVIKGFINPYVVILHKKMFYKQDTLYRLAIIVAQIVFSIIFGYWLQSASGLVLALVAAALVEVFISFTIFKQRPVFNYLSSRAKIIFDNAKWLSVGSLLQYLVQNIDDFLIGAITNTHLLGIYHNSYSMTHKATYEIAKSTHYGTIPVYTKITDNFNRLKKAFARSLGITLLIALLIAIPIFIWNQTVVTLLLGEKWLEAIPIIRPLIVAGLVETLCMASYTLMLAIKKYKVMNLHLLSTLVLMIVLIYFFGQAQGLIGTVKGLMWSRILSLPIIFYFLFHFFDQSG